MPELKTLPIDFHTILFICAVFIACFMVAYFLKKRMPAYDSFVDYNIEGLRGFACLLVFISHAAYSFHSMGYNNTSISYKSFYSTGGMGSLGVELFFCITGYLFSSKIKTCSFDASYFRKRIYRLAPAYIAISSLVFIIFLIENHSRVDSFLSIASIFRQVFGFGFFGSGIELNGVRDATLNAVTWSLVYEWKFYAAIPFLALALHKRSDFFIISLFALATIFLDIQSGKIIWVYFITGFASSYIVNPKIKMNGIVANVFSLLAVSLIIVIDVPTSGIVQYGMVSALFIWVIYSRPSILSFYPLCIIGTISYSFYLLHQVVLHLSVVIYANTIVDLASLNNIGLMIITMITAAVTVLLSVYSYMYIEHRFYKRKRGAAPAANLIGNS